jgi:hypothetical protein
MPMARAATRGGDFDAALKDKARDLMILHGPATSSAAKIFDEAVEVADSKFEIVVQLDDLAILTQAERDAWFPGGGQGFCVLKLNTRAPYSRGTLDALMSGGEPSEDNIVSALNGDLT